MELVSFNSFVCDSIIFNARLDSLIRIIAAAVMQIIPIIVNPIVSIVDISPRLLVIPPIIPATAKILIEEYSNTSAFLKYLALIRR